MSNGDDQKGTLKMLVNKKKHLIVSKKMSKEQKVRVKELIRIRNAHWNEYQSILPEIEERINKHLIERGLVDENGKPMSKYKGKCRDVWSLEKKLMKERFNVDWPTTADLNPGTKFV